MTETVEFIFVYGTLRRTARTRMAQVLSYHSEYVGEAFMQGCLYEVQGYPGVVESSDVADKVYGELHKITNNNTLLTLLDIYEECTDDFPEPHEYVRKVLPVTLISTGETVMAWVYVYNWDISRLVRIG